MINSLISKTLINYTSEKLVFQGKRKCHFILDLDAASTFIIDSRAIPVHVRRAGALADGEGISKDQEDKSMYSIKELSDMAGVSARTLRWYDRIGLLKPAFVNDAGYRFYGEREVDLLQQILFYRERGMELKKIRSIIYEEGFDIMAAMEEHLCELEEQKVLDMSEEDYERFQNLGEEIRRRLEKAVQNGISPESEEAGRIVTLHKEWLGMTWKKYTEEAHKAVANMYISDERFKLYYDRKVPGCAQFLEKAIRYKIGE